LGHDLSAKKVLSYLNSHAWNSWYFSNHTVHVLLLRFSLRSQRFILLFLSSSLDSPLPKSHISTFSVRLLVSLEENVRVLGLSFAVQAQFIDLLSPLHNHSIHSILQTERPVAVLLYNNLPGPVLPNSFNLYINCADDHGGNSCICVQESLLEDRNHNLLRALIMYSVIEASMGHINIYNIRLAKSSNIYF